MYICKILTLHYHIIVQLHLFEFFFIFDSFFFFLLELNGSFSIAHPRSCRNAYCELTKIVRDGIRQIFI